MSGGGAPAGGGPCRVSDSGARSPSPSPRIGAVRSFPALRAGYVPDATGPDVGHLPHPRSGRGFSFPLPGVEARGLGIAASGPHGFVCFVTGPLRPAWVSVPPRSGEKLPEESRWPWSPVVGSGSARREETRGAALFALSQRTHQSPRAAAVEGSGPGAYGGPAPRRSALGAPAARPAAAPRSSVLAHTPPRRDSGGCSAPAPFLRAGAAPTRPSAPYLHPFPSQVEERAGARSSGERRLHGSGTRETRLSPRGRVVRAGGRTAKRALPGLAWACSEPGCFPQWPRRSGVISRFCGSLGAKSQGGGGRKPARPVRRPRMEPR